MPHDIDTTTGRAAAMFVGQPAWHGLGAVIEKAASSREAITLAGLDWKVEQWPLHATDPESGHAATADDHVANVRTDTKAVLGVVGRKYHVFQNHEAFDFMDSLVGDKLCMYETAGSLKGGRRVWMLARIPKEYRAGPDDLIQPYVLLVNSHDGSGALRMIPTTVRVVCANTLNLALSRAAGEGFGGLAIRHRPNLDDRVKEARQKLGIVAARFDAFDEELHAMLSEQLSGKQLQGYFESVLPNPRSNPRKNSRSNATGKPSERAMKRRQQTIDQFHTNLDHDTNTLRGIKGTAWAAYNAVSQWADHQRGFRGEGVQRQANRLNSVWFGASHDLKQRAWKEALELSRN